MKFLAILLLLFMSGSTFGKKRPDHVWSKSSWEKTSKVSPLHDLVGCKKHFPQEVKVPTLSSKNCSPGHGTVVFKDSRNMQQIGTQSLVDWCDGKTYVRYYISGNKVSRDAFCSRLVRRYTKCLGCLD